MRTLLLLAIALAPAASAASQVHVTFLGDAYAATYVDDASGAVVTQRAPLDAGGYELDGRRYPLAPPPAPDGTARVVFVSDIGTDRNASAIVELALAQKPSLVLIGGDLAYAHGDLDLWEKWFTIMEPLASSVPTMPAYGNHEGYCTEPDGGYTTCAEERRFYEERFELPNDEHLYYAFDWGPLHVTVLDTEAYLGDDDHPTAPDEQRAFLEDSLANDSRRWDIVMYHRALRTTNTHEGASVGDQREELEPILDGGADLVLQAHVHAYERARTTEKGTLFVTSGGGGRPTYDEWEPMAPWLAKRAAEHHIVVLDVSPTRIDGRAVLLDNTTIDSFSLERPAPPTPTPKVPPTTASPSPVATTSPAPTGTPAPPTAASVLVEEANTPGAWPLALVAVMLSARLLGRRARG